MADGHCFISYSHADGLEFVTKLADELEGGHPFTKVWFEKREMVAGREDWDDQLANAIRNCKCLLYVMSPDSTASNSNCKEEWAWALKYKKPVICIWIDNKAEDQFRLNSRQKIDFTTNFDQGLARLRKSIAHLDSPEGQLEELNHRLADANRDLRRAKPEDVARVQVDIDELKKQIEMQEKIVANPKAAAEQTQKNIEAGLERERRPEKETKAKETSTKFINPPPGIAPTYFQDRTVETEQVFKFLQDDSQRLMTIVGRGGVGKTAMVCRLLKGLEGGELPDGLGNMRVEGIVYLSESGSHRINFANLFYDLCKLLPADAANALDAVYKNPQASTASKMSALLDRFTAGKVVLLLDNVEPLISVEIFDIEDAELDECLRALLHGAHSALKVILTTRVAPRGLNLYEPGKQRMLTLDSGLEQKYAVEMLREMDMDGKLGLKSADPEALKRAYERTLGFPRALEALFAILASDRYTTLDELLAMPTPENVVEALVGEAFNRLDVNAQKVMQALAVYNRPVTPAAVDFLLAPHVPAIDSAPILQRLANMHFARKESGRFYLHPVDREFAFGLIPQEDLTAKTAKDAKKNQKTDLVLPKYEELFKTSRSLRPSRFDAFTQHDLTSRAADYFRQARKPRAEWKKLDDLSAQLAEFDLRCTAGDHDTAASLLTDIDYDYLLLWGHYRLMIDLHEKLQAKINDKDLARRSIGNLGQALSSIGKVKQAIINYEKALSMAREVKNRQAEEAWLGNLGGAYALLGEARKAIEYREQALVIDREIGDRKGESNDLLGIGQLYDDLGDARKALEYYEEASVIAREIGDRWLEESILTSIGITHLNNNETKKSKEFLEQALVISHEIGDKGGETFTLNAIGSIFSKLGEVKIAIGYYEQVLEISKEISARSSEGMALSNIASEYAGLGEAEKSIQYYQEALQNAREIGNKYGESKRLNGLAGVLIEKGDLQNAIKHSKESLQIGQEMSSPEVCNGSGSSLAQAYLFQNDLVNARAAVEAALGYDVPQNNHNASALHGIIALRQGDEVAARGAFLRAIGQADEVLSKTADYYSALDAKGLALSGLAITTGDSQLKADCHLRAIETFGAARKIAPHAGVVKSVLRLFDELVKCDNEGILKDVRKAMEVNPLVE